MAWCYLSQSGALVGDSEDKTTKFYKVDLKKTKQNNKIAGSVRWLLR